MRVLIEPHWASLYRHANGRHSHTGYLSAECSGVWTGQWGWCPADRQSGSPERLRPSALSWLSRSLLRSLLRTVCAYYGPYYGPYYYPYYAPYYGPSVSFSFGF